MTATHLVVRNYMRPDVISISPETTLHEALERMLKDKTNALVVCGLDKKVAGIVTSWDIIELIVPDYLEHDQKLAIFEAGHLFQDRINELKDLPVAKFMSTDVYTVTPEDSLIATAAHISQFHIRQLPVVSEDGTLVGYINHTDIKRAIGDVLGEESAASM